MAVFCNIRVNTGYISGWNFSDADFLLVQQAAPSYGATISGIINNSGYTGTLNTASAAISFMQANKGTFSIVIFPPSSSGTWTVTYSYSGKTYTATGTQSYFNSAGIIYTGGIPAAGVTIISIVDATVATTTKNILIANINANTINLTNVILALLDYGLLQNNTGFISVTGLSLTSSAPNYTYCDLATKLGVVSTTHTSDTNNTLIGGTVLGLQYTIPFGYPVPCFSGATTQNQSFKYTAGNGSIFNGILSQPDYTTAATQALAFGGIFSSLVLTANPVNTTISAVVSFAQSNQAVSTANNYSFTVQAGNGMRLNNQILSKADYSNTVAQALAIDNTVLFSNILSTSLPVNTTQSAITAFVVSNKVISTTQNQSFKYTAGNGSIFNGILSQPDYTTAATQALAFGGIFSSLVLTANPVNTTISAVVSFAQSNQAVSTTGSFNVTDTKGNTWAIQKGGTYSIVFLNVDCSLNILATYTDRTPASVTYSFITKASIIQAQSTVIFLDSQGLLNKICIPPPPPPPPTGGPKNYGKILFGVFAGAVTLSLLAGNVIKKGRRKH